MNKHRVTTQTLIEKKQHGEKIAMLTSYDYTMARLIDQSGVDMILIGDSASNVMAGNATTIPITVDEMIYHARSVCRAVEHAFVVCDMPFGSYQISVEDGMKNAVKIMKETGCDAVKLEGGKAYIPFVTALVNAGIPVVGHLGLTPQSVKKFGGFGLRAKESKEAECLINDAKLLEEAGCSAVVLEKIPAELATIVTQQLSIPTIGIGAGSGVDGQVLVVTDMLGMDHGFTPKFLRRYADLETIIIDAAKRYVNDVSKVDFPSKEEQY